MITVTINKADNMVWTEAGVLDATAVTGDETVTGVYAGAVLKLNPKTGEPYVAFGVRGADNKLTVAKFDGSQWAKVGAASFTNIIAGSNYSMDIALDGTPYILYSDKGSANQKSPSVMKYNGSAWEQVGTQGYETLSPAYMGIRLLLLCRTLPLPAVMRSVLPSLPFGTEQPGRLSRLSPAHMALQLLPATAR